MSSVAENANIVATALKLKSGAWSANPTLFHSLEMLVNLSKPQYSSLIVEVNVTYFSTGLMKTKIDKWV